MKPFYLKALAAADEILVSRKQLPGQSHTSQPSWVATSAGLAAATVSMLRNRRPLVFCIDEAQHLGVHSTERQMAKNLDAIKTFADETETPLLLVGTCQLVEFPALSGQLARRIRAVHFGRHTGETKEGRQDFRSILHFFAKHLPLEDEYDLVGTREYLQECSAGCVGVLKHWLDRALYRAFAAARDRVTARDVEACEPPCASVNKWIDEIGRGEARLRELDTPNGAVEAVAASPAKTLTRPFERKRIADPVGDAA